MTLAQISHTTLSLISYRVDWALLPLSTSKSGELSVAGNCLLYHQPLLPATKGPQQTSLLRIFMQVRLKPCVLPI